VDAAVRLEDEEARLLDELVRVVAQEVVALEHQRALSQLRLGAVKVEVHAEALKELQDGVAVGVFLLLNDFHEALDLVPVPAPVDDHRRSKVAQQPRRVDLDGLEVLLVKERVDDVVRALIGRGSKEEESAV